MSGKTKIVSTKTLDEIEALLAEASPAPWVDDDGNMFSKPMSDERMAHILDKSKPKKRDHAPGYPYGFIGECGQMLPNGDNDTAAICALRNAAPELLKLARTALLTDEVLRPLAEEAKEAMRAAGDLGDFDPSCKAALLNLAYVVLAGYSDEEKAPDAE